MSEILVIIKSSNADKTEVQVDPSVTVLEFKSLITEKISIEPALQRLIYKGRVLKDDCTLSFYDVQDGHTIHLVKGGGGSAAATPSTATATATPIGVPSSASPNPYQGMNIAFQGMNMGNMGAAQGGMPSMPGK